MSFIYTIWSFISYKDPSERLKENWKKLCLYYEKANFADDIDVLEETSTILEEIRQLIIDAEKRKDHKVSQTFFELRIVETLCEFAKQNDPEGAFNVILESLTDYVGSIDQVMAAQSSKSAILHLLKNGGDKNQKNDFQNSGIAQEKVTQLTFAMSEKLTEEREEAHEKLTTYTKDLFDLLLPCVNTWGKERAYAEKGLISCFKISDPKLLSLLCDKDDIFDTLLEPLTKTVENENVDWFIDLEYSQFMKKRIQYIEDLYNLELETLRFALDSKFKSKVLTLLFEKIQCTSQKSSKAAIQMTRFLVEETSNLSLQSYLLTMITGPSKPEDSDEGLFSIIIDNIDRGSEKIALESLKLIYSLLCLFPFDVYTKCILCTEFDPNCSQNKEYRYFKKYRLRDNNILPGFFEEINFHDASMEPYLEDAHVLVARYFPMCLNSETRETQQQNFAKMLLSLPSENNSSSALTSSFSCPTSPVSMSKNIVTTFPMNNDTMSMSESLNSSTSLSSSLDLEYGSSGSLLPVLLSKFKTFMSNSVEFNLVLTGITARIAVLPFPTLHKYMFRKSSPSLNSTLETIKIQINEISKKIDQVEEKFVDMKTVMGLNQSESFENSSSGAILRSELPNEVERKYLKNMVILSEFRKEIQAIIRAKQLYHKWSRLSEYSLTDIYTKQ
eukprot:gb/GECH01010241.1/.p1 GENE.gb/GECH01010241.1/~~gb/GECH01010241.1/.p1  ORF type:complete len:671 (+),score=141.94 gb/GECH01010241.1/:1-2013(+)